METLIFSVDIVEATAKLAQIRVDVEAYKKQQKELADEVKKGNTEAAQAYEVLGGAIRNMQGEQRNLTKQIDGYVAVQKKQTDQQKFSNNSIQQNRDLLKQLTAQYINLKNPSVDATNQIKKLSDTLKQQESAIGDTRRNVGNYKDALSGLPGALGNATQSSLRLFDTLKANPYIAIIGLVYQFINALKQNEKAAELFERAMAGVESVVQTIADVTVEAVESLGFLKNAFSDPVGTIKELGRVVQDNLITRFKALGGFVEAIALVFDGEFSAAAKKASNSALELTTGIKGLGDRIGENISASVQATRALQEIEDAERELAKQTALTTTEIEKQKNLQTSGKTLAERQKAANEVIRLSKEIRDAEVKFANDRVAALKLLADANKGNEAFQQKLTDAVISQQQVLQGFYASTRKAEKVANDDNLKELLAARKKYNEEIANLEFEFFATERERTIKGFNDKLNLIKGKSEEEKNLRIAIENAKQKALDELNKKQAAIDEAKEQEKRELILKNAMLSLETELIILQTNGEQTFEKLLEIEDAKQTAIIENDKLSFEEREKLLAESNFRLQELYNADANAAILADEKKRDARIGIAQATVNSLSSLASLAGLQGEEMIKFQKLLALAQIAIDTAKSISAGIAGATASAAATGPGAFIATPAFIATTVATILGAVAQATAILSKTQPPKAPKFEDGGEVSIMADGGKVIPIKGKSHRQGGENVQVGGRTVANIEGGEGMYIMKKTAFQSINKYSNINKAFGGRSWTGATTKYAADGGRMNTTLPVSDASQSVNSQIEQSILLAEAFKNLPPTELSLVELAKRQAIMDKSIRVSEL